MRVEIDPPRPALLGKGGLSLGLRDHTPETLNALAPADFLRFWIEMIGQPPAVIVERPVMVQLLLECLPPPSPLDRSACAAGQGMTCPPNIAACRGRGGAG